MVGINSEGLAGVRAELFPLFGPLKPGQVAVTWDRAAG